MNAKWGKLGEIHVKMVQNLCLPLVTRNIKKEPNRWRPRFILGRCFVRVSAGEQDVLTQVFRGFTQFLHKLLGGIALLLGQDRFFHILDSSAFISPPNFII
jgi:hypothetical protein